MRTLQSQIAWCTRAQRTLIVIVGVSALAFYLFCYRPQSRKLTQLMATARAHQVELVANQTKAAARNEIAAKNEKLRQELDLIKKPSKQNDVPNIYKELNLFAQQSLLKKFAYKPSGIGMPTRSDLFMELPIQLTFEGDFVAIFNFLRSTEDLQRLIRVRSLSLKNAGRSGQVQAEMAVNIYLSTE